MLENEERKDQNDSNDANEENEDVEGLIHYKLRRPIVVDGQTYSELIVDLDSLTAEDMMACERQLNKTKEFIYVKEMSKPYLALVIAKAAKVPVHVVNKLSGKDFSKLTVQAQNFLLS